MEDTRRAWTTLVAHLTPLRVRMLRHRKMAGRDRTFKCWVTLAYGSWVAIALLSDLRVTRRGSKMKVLFLSFAVGLGVGGLYGLIRVKSPAPPIVALLGLWGWCLANSSGFG